MPLSQHPIRDELEAIRVRLILRLLRGDDKDDEVLRQQRLETFTALIVAWDDQFREGRPD